MESQAGGVEKPSQEIPMAIKLRDLSRYPQGTERHRLTELPINKDNVRTFLARKFTECIRQKKDWACIFSDLDQLKVINDNIDKKRGDEYIRWGGERIIQALESAQLSDQAEVFVVAASQAADENITFIFNPTKEDLEKLEAMKQKLGIPQENKDIPYNYSISSGLATSTNETLGMLGRLNGHILDKPDSIAWETFDEVTALADENAKEEKLNKQLEHFYSLKTDQVNIQEFTEMLTAEYGGNRVSKNVFNMLAKLQAVQGSIFTLRQLEPRDFEGAIVKLGINKAQMQSAKTVGQLLELHDVIFKKEFVV